MSLRSFESRYPFKCGCCQSDHLAGEMAVYGSNGSLVSPTCPNLPPEPNILTPGFLRPEGNEDDEDGEFISEEERIKARQMMCKSCFLVHAGECL